MTGSFRLRIVIISVVIGGHFGGGDHFDGGDHLDGGTRANAGEISASLSLHSGNLTFITEHTNFR